MSEAVLVARALGKRYSDGALDVSVLERLEFSVAAGESVAILGASGSGKSTLLHLLGGLDMPSSGQVFLCGQDYATLDERQRGIARNRHLGFVYQFHHLLPEFTALENVAMPAMIAGRGGGYARERAETLLTGLGLGERLDHQPAQLSGGEQQRVAIARALTNEPRLLLADEPTGNLDPETATAVFQQLYELARTTGVAAVIATHNLELARYMDRVFAMKDGHLEKQRG